MKRVTKIGRPLVPEKLKHKHRVVTTLDQELWERFKKYTEKSHLGKSLSLRDLVRYALDSMNIY